MEKKELDQIEAMMSRLMGQFRGEISQGLAQSQSVIRGEMRQFRDEIIGKFDRAIGTTEDHLQRKLDFIVEGHQMLVEKLEEARSELKVGPKGNCRRR